MTRIDIAPVSESAFAMMEDEAEERAFVEEKADRIAAAGNWFARKKLFIDLLEELDATSDLAAELAEAPEITALLEEAVRQFKGSEPPPDVAAQSPDANEAGPGVAPDADEEWEDGPLPGDPFAIVVPVYVGAVLERLAEKQIECLEQAAIYTLSTHEEHQVAAWSWFNAEPKRLGSFRKFMKANPRYRDALKRVMIADQQFESLEGGEEP
jgi:hypothetical protein